MEMTAREIARYISGDVVGDGNAKVSTVARIESGKPGSLCFLANPKYEHYLYTCKASVIIVNRSFELRSGINPGTTLVLVDDSYQAIATMLEVFNRMKASRKKGVSWRSHVSWSAKLGKGVYVGPSAYIGRGVRIGSGTQIYPGVYVGEGSTVGSDCILYPGVKVYQGCVIGNRCTVHANSVIGSDGFGFAPVEDGTYKKIPQTGNVVLEDDVEIGANTVVDRATMGSTFVRRGTKIDNLVQIAHNVEVGSDTVIAAQTGIAGSSKVGPNSMIGGQVGIAGHLSLAKGIKIAAQSGVMSSIKEENAAIMGSPAFNHSDYMRAYAIFRKLHKSK